MKRKTYKTKGGKWASYILLAVWMFLLGVFVGRGTITVPFKKKPETYANKISPIQKNSAKNSNAAERPTEKQNYYEKLKNPNFDNVADKKFLDLATLKNEGNTTQDANKTETTAKAPDANKTEKTKPEKEKAEEIKESFIIQAASFLNGTDSAKFIATLKSKGYNAYESAVTVKEKVWHRVRIGPLKTRAEAENIVKNLKKERVEPIIITVKKGP